MTEFQTTEFRLLDPGDVATHARIIESADEILRSTLAHAWPHDPSGAPKQSDWLGTSRYCEEASDAVTRAAHQMGIAASREFLVGWHYLTSFGPPGQPPSEDDLVIDLTWGQMDPAMYNGGHPRSRRPFIGTRRELGALLPDSAHVLGPDAVLERQIVHAPQLAERPDLPHTWLRTTPEEVATGAYSMGQTEQSAYPDNVWN